MRIAFIAASNGLLGGLAAHCVTKAFALPSGSPTSTVLMALGLMAVALILRNLADLVRA